MLSTQRNRPARHVLLSLFLVVLSLGAVVACAQNTATNSPTATTVPTIAPTSQPSIPAITVKAMDFFYDLPQTIPAGLVDITLVNSGVELHAMGLVQLNNGVTYDQFHSALLQKGLLVMRTMGTLMGGPNNTLPGKSTEVILNLPVGQYVALCATPAKDGVRQYLKGMISSFTVTAPSSASQAPAPTATAQVLLKSFSIGLPAPIAAGPITWQVTNSGQEPYEMTLVKLAPGKTARDVSAFYIHPSGPPPFANIGGMSSISPGLSGWVKLDVVAGNYVALSVVFDRATGKPQFLLGMITSFTVQ